MTEEEIRAIVRDEIEAETIREGGIFDQCRSMAFNMTRGHIEIVLKRALGAYEPKPEGGAAESLAAPTCRTDAPRTDHKS